MSDPFKKMFSYPVICILLSFFPMGAHADIPVDSSKILALQEKELRVTAVSHYNGLVHEYQEDLLNLKSDREWLVVRMLRIEDQKRQVPGEMIAAKDRIDSKQGQRVLEIDRMKELTEKHLAELRALDTKVRGANGENPDWWHLDAWIYGLMYPEKKGVQPDMVSVPGIEAKNLESFHISASLQRDLEEKIKSVELDNWVALVQKESELTLEVQLPILFGLGQSSVAKDYKPFFKKLAWLLKPYSVRIEVAGYSDSDAQDINDVSSNMALGVSRAKNVVQELIETGMLPASFKIIGEGESGSTDPARKELNAAMKRRVDVRVYFENEKA